MGAADAAGASVTRLAQHVRTASEGVKRRPISRYIPARFPRVITARPRARPPPIVVNRAARTAPPLSERARAIRTAAARRRPLHPHRTRHPATMPRVALHVGLLGRVRRPFCVLYVSSAPPPLAPPGPVQRAYEELGRTETLDSQPGPGATFVRSFVLDLPADDVPLPPDARRFRLALYDRKPGAPDDRLDAHAFLGSARFSHRTLRARPRVDLPLSMAGASHATHEAALAASLCLTLRPVPISNGLFAAARRLVIAISVPVSRRKEIPYSLVAQSVDISVADDTRAPTEQPPSPAPSSTTSQGREHDGDDGDDGAAAQRHWLPLYRSESLRESADPSLVTFDPVAFPEWRFGDDDRAIRIRINLYDVRARCMRPVAVAVTSLEQLQNMDPLTDVLPLVAPPEHADSPLACNPPRRGHFILQNAEPTVFGGIFTLRAFYPSPGTQPLPATQSPSLLSNSPSAGAVPYSYIPGHVYSLDAAGFSAMRYHGFSDISHSGPSFDSLTLGPSSLPAPSGAAIFAAPTGTTGSKLHPYPDRPDARVVDTIQGNQGSSTSGGSNSNQLSPSRGNLEALLTNRRTCSPVTRSEASDDDRETPSVRRSSSNMMSSAGADRPRRAGDREWVGACGPNTSIFGGVGLSRRSSGGSSTGAQLPRSSSPSSSPPPKYMYATPPDSPSTPHLGQFRGPAPLHNVPAVNARPLARRQHSDISGMDRGLEGTSKSLLGRARLGRGSIGGVASSPVSPATGPASSNDISPNSTASSKKGRQRRSMLQLLRSLPSKMST
jgi:hypothetical protein